MPDRPARPPEAEMIKRARERLRLSIPEAAAAISRDMTARGARSGLSAARLRQVEAGYQTKEAGVQVPTAASAAILAHAARFYGIAPEGLRGEGERPDAAAVLEDLLASEPPAPEPGADPAAGLADEPGPGTPEDRGAWTLFPGDDLRSRVKRMLWRIPDTSEEDRLEMIEAINQAGKGEPGSGSGRRAQTA